MLGERQQAQRHYTDRGTTTDSGLIIQSFTDASVAANARVTISTTTGAEGGTVDRVTGTCSYYKDVE